jgi:hypothetical protein
MGEYVTLLELLEKLMTPRGSVTLNAAQVAQLRAFVAGLHQQIFELRIMLAASVVIAILACFSSYRQGRARERSARTIAAE